MKKLTVLLLSTFLLYPFISKGQSNYTPNKKYNSKELIEDFYYLISTLHKAHPALYWHTPSLKFHALSADYMMAIRNKKTLTENEFLHYAAHLNNAIRCVHSDIRPSDAFDKWWRENALLIPFNIISFNNKYYIYQNYSDRKALTSGSEVLTINGQSINTITDSLFHYITSDKANETRKKNALTGGFYRYYYYYIQNTSPTYTITFIPFGSTEKKTITVKGIKKRVLDERRDSINSLSPPEPPISTSFIDSLNTAILKISTFRNDLFESSGIVYQNYLDSVFTIIKQKRKENLIIDLRDNGGGYSEYGVVLLSYLTNKNFTYCRNQWLTTDKLLPNIKYDIPETFGDFPNGIVREDGGYKWKKHSILGTRKPAENNFTGKVYFLINGGCVSTTSEVASVAKENQMGIFIGEEVGGTYAGDNGGVLGWVELPNTKIRARIAMVKYELAVTGDNDGHGVMPDYYAMPNIEEFIKGKDVAMEKALQLIKEKH